MKVALVHDYIKEYGGAERVLEALHDIYPDATVFTSVYLPQFLGPHKERFKDWKIKTSWLQQVPFNAKLISPFRLVSASVFRDWDFSEFDVVIVSATGAYFPNAIKTGEGTLHICYCHTPPRYLYGYATARNWKKNKVFALLAGIANHWLRMVDYDASKHVDYYIANSEEVAQRVKKFYRRDATVVYPPVEVGKAKERKSERANKDENTVAPLHSFSSASYYLTGGRLARAKHVDVIVRACSELGVPLKVFGKSFAGYGEELEQEAQNGSRLRSNNIEFLGEVSDEEKLRLMAGAKAFLFASEDEDFGITPVEAMGAGTPVIAYRSGGVKETVVDGKTGLFFDELTVGSLKQALEKFEKQKFDPKVCRARAEKFSEERFKEEIREFVREKVQRRNSGLSRLHFSLLR